jgi:uncharacterized protein YaeQ
MALKATIFKATVQVADMDRHFYDELQLTLARHPSETDERMMIRLLAFVLHANDQLQFTKGISTDDEPDLWQKSLSGEIEVWIDIGLPDESRIRKACNRARQVRLYTYGARTMPPWWEKMRDKVSRFDNLEIAHLPAEATGALASLARKTMALQCTIEDGQVWLGDEQTTVEVLLEVLYPGY